MLRAAAAICVVLSLHADIIDRIAVSIGNQVITTDQIDDEIRIAAFLAHEQPKLTAEERKQAAERLIEQTLIKREMDLTHYPVPDVAEADPLVNKIEAEYPDRETFLNALAHYNINLDKLRRDLWWQLTLLKFTDER